MEYRSETISNALFMSQTERAYTATDRTLGPDLRLTATRSPGLPFNGRHPRNPCN